MAFRRRNKPSSSLLGAGPGTGTLLTGGSTLAPKKTARQRTEEVAKKVGALLKGTAEKTARMAKATANAIDENLKKDKMLSAGTLSELYQTQSEEVIEFPVITLAPIGNTGALQKFESPDLTYDLERVAMFAEGNNVFYIVQQSDKKTHKRGWYAFVDNQGRPLEIKINGTSAPKTFFKEYEFIERKDAKLTVRVRLNQSSPYINAEVTLEEPTATTPPTTPPTLAPTVTPVVV